MHWIIIHGDRNAPDEVALALEDRTARLTFLIDPRKKAVFERLCAEEDLTPSQVVRRLVRRYIEERTGSPWTADTNPTFTKEEDSGTKEY